MYKVTALLLSLFLLPTDGGHKVGFEETFALSEDRTEALEQLIPGTADYYYYSCLQLQHEGRFEQVGDLLDLWQARHGYTARLQEIKNRQLLLGFAADPGGTYRDLAKALSLKFNHRKQVANEESPLPSRLPENLVILGAWTKRALKHRGADLFGFEPSMWESLATMAFSEKQLRAFLTRLERPDIPNLPALVARNLESKVSTGFGSLEIHKRLLLNQLEELAALRPALMNSKEFIATYLTRLQPSMGADWKTDPVERLAYLERLDTFVQRLTPAHDTLKAHVLQARLQHDLAQGSLNRDRFLRFLRLPHPSLGLVKPAYRDRRAQLSASVIRNSPRPLGNLDSIETLIRTYLERFFEADNNWESYADYLLEDYLRRVFVETKILTGQGDRERWYSLLDDSAYYEQLEARVEIDFVPTSKTQFHPGEAVSLELDVKNVGTLLVKVFEIDAAQYARKKGSEVDASIDLDGLVAGSEKVYNYDSGALRRVRRHFDFPTLKRPGVYVIDFIGGGLSSRAVIKKGSLSLRSRLGSAGHVFQVLDGSGNLRKSASLRLGKRQYSSDDDGEILIPYTREQDKRSLILESGRLVAVEEFEHRAERYELNAGFHIQHESLRSGEQAQLLLRVDLKANGYPADLMLLEQTTLTIVATDMDGTATSQSVRDLQLKDDSEYIHLFTVPDNMRSLSFTLTGQVQSLSQDTPVPLFARSTDYRLNTIVEGNSIFSPILSQDSNGYYVDVLGKNGEAQAHRPMTVAIHRRGFRGALKIELKTSENGRVHLGPLTDVWRVQVSGFAGIEGDWPLREGRRTALRDVHGTTAGELRLPFTGDTNRLTRADVSLLELRAGLPMADRFAHVSLRDGSLTLRGLAPGDYSLLQKSTGEELRVRITDGEVHGGWAMGKNRQLEVQGPILQLLSKELSERGLEIQLANSNAHTRVHLFTSRFDPTYDAFQGLSPGHSKGPRATYVSPTQSTYNSGREISDEYRYILERRFAKKYPGNMLERPGLLLNPWSSKSSMAMVTGAGSFGGRFGGKRSRQSGGAVPRSPAMERTYGVHPGTFPNLEFLPSGGVTLTNLRPDANGRLLVPLEQLGDGQHIRVIILDGRDQMECRLVRAETPLITRDRRLAGALPSREHFSEQRRIGSLAAGESASLQDGASARAVLFGTLGEVFQLYSTLRPETELHEFAFLIDWPSLSAEEKQSKYSSHASHELHVFLHQKDKEFFDGTVRPYLQSKAEKTFVDHWLLGNDLAPYLDPWKLGRLNAFELALMAQRLPDHAQSLARALKDRTEITPKDTAEFEALYAVALAAGSMSTTRNGSLQLGRSTYRGPGDSLPPGAAGRSVYLDEGEPDILSDSPMPNKEALSALGYAGASEEKQTGSDDFFLGHGTKAAKKDSERRESARQFYTGPGRTKQYVEHNYFHVPIGGQLAHLIEPNEFWLDLANRVPGSSFQSKHFAQATGNLTEMLMALAMLDLPFEAAEHPSTSEDGLVTLTAASPLILVRKEVAPAEAIEGTNSLLVGQQYFPLAERFITVDGRRQERRVEDEFLVGVAYGCRVVITNPTPEAIDLELLIQIPAGAIPLQQTNGTRGLPLRLAAYNTHSTEYSFYFPVAGTWGHFPAHATRGEHWLATATAHELHVVESPTVQDTTSWEFVSQEAELPDVLSYLENHNLLRLNLDRIAWRMADAKAFAAITATLDRRHHFDSTLWSYSLRHEDQARAKEYLKHRTGWKNQAGPWLESPLLSIDPIEELSFERMEFRPLFGARAHPQSESPEIFNLQVAQQYRALMDILCHKPKLDSTDWMAVTYQLLLQDRTEEALAAFARIDSKAIEMDLQYDYMRAYMDFFSTDTLLARGIAESHAQHPVAHWRKRFQQIHFHLDESQGLLPESAESDNPNSRNDRLAASEASLNIEMVGDRVSLTHKNLEQVELRYYVMDVEFLFSTSPFVQDNAGAFNFVRPNRMDQLQLEAGTSSMEFTLPEQFRNSNVLVEAHASGLVSRHPYYANSLDVNWMENYGQLKVTHKETGEPLARVYVKVFAQQDGRSRFHKDGYTDLRGRFDYVSLSGTNSADVERFSVLVFDQEHGAAIRELEPPQK